MRARMLRDDVVRERLVTREIGVMYIDEAVLVGCGAVVGSRMWMMA